MVGYKLLIIVVLIIFLITVTIFVSLIAIITRRKKIINFDIFSTTKDSFTIKKKFAPRKSLNPMLMENSTFFIVQKIDKNYVPNKILQYDLKNFTIFNIKGKMYEIS